MKIVHLSAEFAPIAKVGGLGDVVLGLSKAQIQAGLDVEVILPKYDSLNLKEIQNLEVLDHDLDSYFDGKWHHNTVWKGKTHSVPLLFIDSQDPYDFFERGSIYGAEDNVERFLYFTRAALEFIFKRETLPDIIHLHDWHVAAAIPLLQEIFLKHKGVKTVLTIHNLSYQGDCTPKHLDLIDLKFTPALEDPFDPKRANLLKGAILGADYVTTVSPTYAKETLDTQGCGLGPTLAKRGDHYVGILNGIDDEYWNPMHDAALPFHFPSKKVEAVLETKKEIKRYLTTTLGLAHENVPLVVAVSRLVSQKGPELIKQALYRTVENGGQFLLLGSSFDNGERKQFFNLKRTLANSHHVHIELTYNEHLSHLAFAAADLVVVPSIFEPCGLTQMIALQYGALPLVRQTGGLADTVFEGHNGFVFKEPTTAELNACLDRALFTWSSHHPSWKKMVENGLKADFSWKNPAQKYVELYKKALHLVKV